MEANTDRGLKVAEFLLSVKAVELNSLQPFTWASGLRSPIYCDNRKLLSFPAIRNVIKEFMSQMIREEYPGAEMIAGVATAGIPIGVLIADELSLPFVYVRTEAKKHGLSNQIEGVITADAKTVVVEDLISTGKSSLRAIEILRHSQATIMGVAAIFSYNLPSSVHAFLEAGCKAISLSNYDLIIRQAIKTGYIASEEYTSLTEWKEDPARWSDAH